MKIDVLAVLAVIPHAWTKPTHPWLNPDALKLRSNTYVLWMEEILHHLGGLKPYLVGGFKPSEKYESQLG